LWHILVLGFLTRKRRCMHRLYENNVYPHSKTDDST
jgi:hypothetical protein